MTAREELNNYRFSVRECLIGDRPFYKQILAVALPMIIQNTLTNVVGLLDNVMIGRVGTLEMSSVAVVNQLLFIFYLCVWGAVSGAGIYGAQFFGKGEKEGVKVVTRYKVVICVSICLVAIAIFAIAGPNLFGFYIAADTPAADVAKMMDFGKGYLYIMLIGLIPFSITQCYSSSLRECGHTKAPMSASMIAMGVNFVFNLLLIFGLAGFPKMGVAGAAIATVISRFVELFIVIFVAHKTKCKEYFTGLFTKFHLPKNMVKPLTMKALPLVVNEFFWSLAMAFILQCYSVRGIGVIAAMNITYTIAQIFNEIYLSLGTATTILVGQKLGANQLVEAKRIGYRMLAMGSEACLVIGGLLCACSPLIPMMYNIEPDIRTLATSLIIVLGCVMPINAFACAVYCTLRAGGKVFITFVFDCGSTWILTFGGAFILTTFTNLPALTIYIIVSSLEIIKCIIGFFLVRKGIWVNNLVENTEV